MQLNNWINLKPSTQPNPCSLTSFHMYAFPLLDQDHSQSNLFLLLFHLLFFYLSLLLVIVFFIYLAFFIIQLQDVLGLGGFTLSQSPAAPNLIMIDKKKNSFCATRQAIFRISADTQQGQKFSIPCCGAFFLSQLLQCLVF